MKIPIPENFSYCNRECDTELIPYIQWYDFDNCKHYMQKISNEENGVRCINCQHCIRAMNIYEIYQCTLSMGNYLFPKDINKEHNCSNYKRRETI